MLNEQLYKNGVKFFSTGFGSSGFAIVAVIGSIGRILVLVFGFSPLTF